MPCLNCSFLHQGRTRKIMEKRWWKGGGWHSVSVRQAMPVVLSRFAGQIGPTRPVQGESEYTLWSEFPMSALDFCFRFLLWISALDFWLFKSFGECPTVQEFLFESWDQLVELLCGISDSDSWITFLTHGSTIQGYLVWSNVDSISDQVEVTIL